MIQRRDVKEVGGKSYRCFFELTMQVIGGKWKPVILYHLSQEKVLRFGALKKSLNGITQRMLTKQLRELEADRIVTRTVFNEVPPKVEYSLTELGESLIPIFLEMKKWGVRYEECIAGEVITGDTYESVDDPD
jgi:DNA-binding HxlR family transcriptional regulator